MGVGLARQLDVPGEELNGVVDAISFIYEIRDKGYASVPVGDKVAVIGMGMTALKFLDAPKNHHAKVESFNGQYGRSAWIITLVSVQRNSVPYRLMTVDNPSSQ